MRVFVTGATGLVGARLLPKLTERGDTVVALSRKAKPSTANVEWLQGDPAMAGPWVEAIDSCDAVIHLAGEPIFGKRWSDAFLKLVKESRVVSTRIIAEAMAKNPKRADGSPKVFVCGSAIGYYGANPGEAELTEDSPPGNDEMADITIDWEKAAEPARLAGVRLSLPRTGIVLDRNGGGLPRMELPFKLFTGGRIGSGKQFVAWIHHADMTGLLLFALDNPELTGPFNAVGPTPIRNAEFSKELAKVLRRPCWLPVPGFMLRIMLGRVAKVVVGGQRALSKKAQDLGYRFQFPTASDALRDLLN
jgi:uncharacterized protein (TIGR01777 family)